MDPASAVLGFIGTAFQIIGEVRDALAHIKAAPTELGALRDRCMDIEHILCALQDPLAQRHLLSNADQTFYGRLQERVQRCQDNMSKLLGEVHIKRNAGMKLSKVKWLWKRRKFDAVLVRFDEVEHALHLMMNYIMIRSSQNLHTTISSLQAHGFRGSHAYGIIISSATACHGSRVTTAPPTISSQNVDSGMDHRYSQSATRCQEACHCLRRGSSRLHLFPVSFAKYLGNISIDTCRIRDTEDPEVACNTRSCKQKGRTVPHGTWTLPPWFFSIQTHLQIPSISLRLSINTLHVIPHDSPVWAAVWNGEVETVRYHIHAGRAYPHSLHKASASDAGTTLMMGIGHLWYNESLPEECALSMLRLCLDAGGDPEMIVPGSCSMLDALIMSTWDYLLQGVGASFICRYKTSRVARMIRSILDRDPVEALENTLDNRGVDDKAKALFGLPSYDNPSESKQSGPLDAAAFNALTGFTALQHAVKYHPHNVSRLLPQDPDSQLTSHALIFEALYHNQPHLIRPLLDAGAHVNAPSKGDITALHLIADRAMYDELKELVAIAEDRIGWDMPTSEGKTAFQIAEASPSLHRLTEEQSKEFLAIFEAHTTHKDEEDETLLAGMPGGYPVTEDMVTTTTPTSS